MRAERKDNNHEKEFSKSVDKILTGEQPEFNASSDAEYLKTVEFAQNLVKQRVAVNPTFKAQLKEQLLSKLTEKASSKKSRKCSVKSVLGYLLPHRPVFQQALAAVLVIAIILGLGSIAIFGRGPSGTSLSWGVVVDKAYAATTEVTSFHFDQSNTTTYWYEGIKFFEDEGPLRQEGDFLAPDRIRWIYESGRILKEVRIIGDSVYKWNSRTDNWEVQYPEQYWQDQVDTFYELAQPNSIDSITERLKYLEDIEELPNEVIDGVNCLHYRGKLDLAVSFREEMEKETRPAVKEYFQKKIDAVEQSGVNATMEIWIGKNDYRVRQQSTILKSTYDKSDISYKDMPGPEDAIITQVSTQTIRLSSFNEPITIEAPVLPDSDWSTMYSGTTESFNGVWGSSSSDVFAVGDNGTIFHYDGISWNRLISGTNVLLTDVWGSSSTDVFAVGLDGIILHYDGSSWSEMSSGTTGNLQGIWGTSASDVFAMGESGIILHYNGSSWSTISTDSNDELDGFYRNIWGSSSTDVYAVGGFSSRFIRHYDGSSWSQIDTNFSVLLLFGIWGSSSDDVFAVGVNGFIVHYDGSSWNEMNSGVIKEWLISVWGSSSTDVFAVGFDGIILRYDGSSWSEMSSGTSGDLTDIWGSSSTDVFAVGTNGKILHYGG